MSQTLERDLEELRARIAQCPDEQRTRLQRQLETLQRAIRAERDAKPLQTDDEDDRFDNMPV